MLLDVEKVKTQLTDGTTSLRRIHKATFDEHMMLEVSRKNWAYEERQVEKAQHSLTLMQRRLAESSTTLSSATEATEAQLDKFSTLENSILAVTDEHREERSTLYRTCVGIEDKKKELAEYVEECNWYNDLAAKKKIDFGKLSSACTWYTRANAKE